MVDTFSALRDKNEERAIKLRNECFVCGYTRSAFDDLGGSFNFDQHVTDEHNLWSYLFFIAYLRTKDPTEYNGVESYVVNMLDEQDLNWIPSRTSWKIENQEGLKLDDEDDSVVFKRLSDQVRGRRSRAAGVWVCGRR